MVSVHFLRYFPLLIILPAVGTLIACLIFHRFSISHLQEALTMNEKTCGGPADRGHNSQGGPRSGRQSLNKGLQHLHPGKTIFPKGFVMLPSQDLKHDWLW